MAHIVVIGSVARDEIVNLAGPLRAGAHLNGSRAGVRLGGGGANTAIALAHLSQLAGEAKGKCLS